VVDLSIIFPVSLSVPGKSRRPHNCWTAAQEGGGMNIENASFPPGDRGRNFYAKWSQEKFVLR